MNENDVLARLAGGSKPATPKKKIGITKAAKQKEKQEQQAAERAARLAAITETITLPKPEDNEWLSINNDRLFYPL